MRNKNQTPRFEPFFYRSKQKTTKQGYHLRTSKYFQLHFNYLKFPLC